MGSPVTSETIAAREYWSCGDAAKILGRGAHFWASLFDAGRVAGYRTEKGKRFILASSARDYLRALCAAHPVVAGPTPQDVLKEAFAKFRSKTA